MDIDPSLPHDVTNLAGRPSGRLGLDGLVSPFGSLLRSPELFRRVLLRDLESTFRGSVLGLLWIVLIPLVMVALYTFVFGVVLKSAWVAQSTSPLEVPLIYFTGLTISGFFLEVINRAPNFIRQHTSYVKKVIFPLDLLDWVLVGTALVKLAISFILLAAFLAIVEQRLPLEVIWVPVLVVPLAVMLVGVAWILSAIGTYVRDLGHALTIISPVIMFVTPVFYSLDQVPEVARGAYLVNPLTFVLEQARAILFFGAGVDWAGYAGYWVAAVIVFWLGFQFFSRARSGFADVI
ncbi:MAG TPA: ABC transporter permease [Devosiaceae bacterium]|jgi:lipopolysaccharide transport system permease protein|nr:ABC transporter permease [Devosiaceae bacterium]